MKKISRNSAIVLLTAAMLVSASCGSSEPVKPADTTAAPAAASATATSTTAEAESEADSQAEEEDTEEAEEDDEIPEDDTDYNEEASADNSINKEYGLGTMISVNRNGLTNISHVTRSKSQKMGEDGTWTIFVYMCGSDLESGGESEEIGAAASTDISEMLNASASSNVRFVIETGGAYRWAIDEISPDELTRLVIQDGNLYKADALPNDDMGKSETLEDFISWGVSEFPAANMGLVMWNHGGGSIAGVCFDELNDSNSLSLVDIDKALYNTFDKMTDKFEFIGFDACLMGTVEAANKLSPYANYMFASQELEPGSGWDYTAIGDFLAENPNANGADLGKFHCDAYYAHCEEANSGDIATFAITDLSKIDDLVVAFNNFADELYTAATDTATLSEIKRNIEKVDNYGGNNRSEGYTNMVDLYGIAATCGEYVKGGAALAEAVDNAVICKVSGKNHPDAMGLSVYFPLSIQGSSEYSILQQVSLSPSYISFVDRLSKAANGESYADYNENIWFDDEGEWTNAYCGNDDEYYWDYADSYEGASDGSSLITFYQEPVVEDGTYYCILDDDGYENTAYVTAYLTQIIDDTDVILGETYDVVVDWDSGEISDYMDGLWLSLPDGQNLSIYTVSMNETDIVYTSPVLLNGSETNLRIRQDVSTGATYIEGAWNGIDENGVSSRDITKLKAGDTICPVYYTFDSETYTGSDYVFDNDPELFYGMLDEGDYFYMFCIYDVFNNYYLSEPAYVGIYDDQVYILSLDELEE